MDTCQNATLLEITCRGSFIKMEQVHDVSVYAHASPGPEVIKLFFVLNSTEHEFSNAYKI